MDLRLFLGVLALFGVIVGFSPAALGQEPAEMRKMIEDAIPGGIQSPRFAEILRDVIAQGNASAATPDNAKLLIYSDAGWSAQVLDSESDSFNQDGSQDSVIDFECKPGIMSTYSVSAQKDTETGYVLLFIIQNFRGIDAGMTKAEYGIVSLAGECGKPGQ